MKVVNPSPRLKAALLADAIVSGAIAVLQVAAPALLSAWLKLPRELIVETGVFLVAYTVVLVFAALEYTGLRQSAPATRQGMVRT